MNGTSPPRFAAPLHPGGRHCLLCGNVTLGAVFPPTNPGQKWRWMLFNFGENPARDGIANNEREAKGHLSAAFALTLTQAELTPVTAPPQTSRAKE